MSDELLRIENVTKKYGKKNYQAKFTKIPIT